MDLKWVIVGAFCAFPFAAAADETREIDGVVYEQEAGAWYQLDADGERWRVRQGRVGVRFEANFPQDSVAAAFHQLGLLLREANIYPGGFYRFSYNDSLEPPNVLAAVLASPHVESAYLDGYLKFFATANDSFYVNQWNLVIARVDRAWDITAGTDSVTVAVIDAGFEIDHDDLESVIWINSAEDLNHNSESFGVYLGTSADTTVIRNTTFDGAVGTALHLQPSESVVVRNSIFMNSGTGLYVNNAKADVDSSCFFYTNDTGIHFANAGTSSTIRSSGITWNTSGGILCDASSAPHIVSNIFAHNGGAIYCSNSSSPTIEANQIQSGGNAITAASSSSPDVGHSSPTGSQSPGNNKIAHAVKYISNSTGASISAQNNCWNVNGGGCSPSASKFVGTVNYTNPICCTFASFSHNEGEPEFEEGFVFQLPVGAPSEPRKTHVTGLTGIVPNPFNPTTTICYGLASQGKVDIKIYDVAGRLVQELANGTQTAGPHSAVWTGTDRRGTQVASGVYFVRMAAAGQVFTKKMVMLK